MCSSPKKQKGLSGSFVADFNPQNDMKKTRHGIEQIIRSLAEMEGSSGKISAACRIYTITDQTYYRCKRK